MNNQGQPPLDYRQESMNLSGTHMREIQRLEQQKAIIISNTQRYVEITNLILHGVDQTIEMHKQALGMLNHNVHGTAAPQPQMQPQQGYAQHPAQQQQPTPAPQAKPVAKQEPKAETKPVEAVAEVVHTPAPAPNGTVPNGS